LSLKVNINFPLFRELKQMGIVVNDGSVERVSGPFGIKMETIKGLNTGGTRTLAKTPIANGVIGVIALEPGAPDSDATNMTLTTDYTLSGTTFTFVGDWSHHFIITTYAYG